MSKGKKQLSSEDFDRIFDEGGDVLEYCDPDSFDRPGLRQRRVGVDMPLAMIDRLDARATASGVTRQALIKSWLSERLDLEDRLDAFARLGSPRRPPQDGAVSKQPERQDQQADGQDEPAPRKADA